MSTNITACLRDTATIPSTPKWLRNELEQAADEIDRLNRRVDELEAGAPLLAAQPLKRPVTDEGIVFVIACKLAELEGIDDPHELIYEGGPIPEPWGQVWQKYEDHAKEIAEALDIIYPGATEIADEYDYRPIYGPMPADDKGLLAAASTPEVKP